MNDIGWCYFAPCVMDSENKVRVVDECLCCSESNTMYSWVIHQLENFKPIYKLGCTLFIFADQLITEDLLTMLNTTENCTLWANQSHLFDHVFPTYFGPAIWNSALASLLKSMLNGDNNKLSKVL